MAGADYIIVGAGSAGCVLANRLSEDPSVQVTLIEAGGRDRSPNIKIPAAFPNQFHSKLDWDYMTEPEPGCHGRALYIPRGKSLGGSSSMNAMLYVRGRPLDYDLWVKAGAEGWGWDDVLPYFLRAEDNSRGASEFHAAGGPLRVSDQRSPRGYNRTILDACQAAGIPYTPDYNGPEQDGVSMFQVTQRDGRRWSAADGYLRPAMDGDNLEVVTKATVLGLEFQGSRVTGVRLGGRRGRSLHAEREVILCAGAINSPQLLMLSGIGRPDELRGLGIQSHMGSLYFEDHGATEHDAPAATIAPTLVAPASRGEVTLRSSDPSDKPKILTNSLTEPEDVASMVAGMELAREIAASEPMRSTITRELKPGSQVSGRDDLESALRDRVELIYHPVGTCRMGSDDDAVIDSELRVRGLQGLRIVDASVMPIIPGGNTNAPVIMVAERAADLIRGRVPVSA